MPWTEERMEVLKKMWLEGQSASQIARELGNVTRNAVIGKVHRMGLSNRNTTPSASEDKAAAPSQDNTVAGTQEGAPEAQAPSAKAESTPPVTLPEKRSVIAAGQPLPPQPSANEVSPEALAKVSEMEKHARKLSLMELTERTCKWPVGDPATEDFWFCGLPVEQGKPYCEAHVGVAFQPMTGRRDRRR